MPEVDPSAHTFGLVEVSRPQLDRAHEIGHRFLDGRSTLPTLVLRAGFGPVQACLVCVCDLETSVIVTLGTGESVVGSRLSRSRPEWVSSSRFFEAWQFRCSSQTSGLWLFDCGTTNGTLLLSPTEALEYRRDTVSDALAHRRLPHPNEPTLQGLTLGRCAHDGEVLVTYAAFVLCHPPTRRMKNPAERRGAC